MIHMKIVRWHITLSYFGEKDDHVYETIPGDDLLQYEEILRMRLNGMLPHRYHPPALPAVQQVSSRPF
jgi:hypothetical protein